MSQAGNTVAPIERMAPDDPGFSPAAKRLIAANLPPVICAECSASFADYHRKCRQVTTNKRCEGLDAVNAAIRLVERDGKGDAL